MARESNEWVARLAQDNKGRFGSFAMLPTQTTDGALRELAYALDVLKADGVGLLTSYDDKWLGHPSFAPVMDELNRRKAVRYTHPTAASCCRNLQPDVPAMVVELAPTPRAPSPTLCSLAPPRDALICASFSLTLVARCRFSPSGWSRCRCLTPGLPRACHGVCCLS